MRMTSAVLADQDEVIEKWGAKARQAGMAVAARAGMQEVRGELIEVGYDWLRDHADDIASWSGKYRVDKIDRTLYLSLFSALREHLANVHGKRVELPNSSPYRGS
jgi:hypothetical protein